VDQDTCDVCPKPRRKRIWCDAHYQRWRKTGDPLAPTRQKAVVELPGERWLPVPGWSSYAVSDHEGRVRSLPRPGTGGGLLAGSTDPDGYLQVQLHDNGRLGNYRRHQLVALAFLGETPEGMEVCHKDGDQLNNNLSNLKHDTHRRNTQERVEHGHHYQANKTQCDNGHKFTEANTRIRRDGARTCKACERDRHAGREHPQDPAALSDAS
jgi:hypothetical protein